MKSAITTTATMTPCSTVKLVETSIMQILHL